MTNGKPIDEGAENEPKPEEGAGSQEGAEGAPKAEPEGQGDGEERVEDKHGQPGINAQKYARDMKAKDDEIAALKAQIEESAKTEEGRAKLQKQIEELEAKHADERITYDLKLAGIRDEKAVKAAKAMLGDYDGDIEKLKADCPYLFSEEKKTGSTGLKHEGAGEDIDAKLDKAMGIKE